jgi:FKBP-type peptidyl-prolyl cis-trans isomerases 1
MKKAIWIPAIAIMSAITLAACFKSNDVPPCTPYTLEQDRHIIDSFIDVQELHYMSFNTDFNMYTGIVSMGDGQIPSDDAKIAFKYTIKLMNGSTIFTSDSLYLNPQTGGKLTPADFKSTNSTPTLEYYFLKRVGKGGVMKVIVPSRIGADCRDQKLQNGNTLPAHAQLIYDFTLTGVDQGTVTP